MKKKVQIQERDQYIKYLERQNHRLVLENREMAAEIATLKKEVEDNSNE